MSAVYPKLRQDLITSRQETADGARFVVKDPATKRFFQFREPEHLIARQLDGSTSLEAIQQRFERELGSRISTEALEQFIDQLRHLGLLQADRPSAAPVRSAGRRILGSPLYIRVKAFDPDRLLEQLLPWVRFCFTPPFIVAAAALIVWAAVTALVNWQEFLRDLERLWRVESLLLAWVAILSVTAVHEFAHGLTCKRFGGHVHEMGFLLLYFQPAFYCNISDAWLFPEKSKRLWVTFAGAFLETFIWSLATLIWWITEPDTWISFVAMIVMATSAIKSFFNLNPLIKLDGYYLLSDYLEIPNLRQRSMDYLKALVGRLFGAPAAALKVTPRERRIYVTYGVLAAAYSYWLLSVVALGFGNYLVEQYQGPGFIAFSGLLMVAFQNPLGRAASGLRSSFRRRRDETGGPTRSEAPRRTRPAIRAVALILGLTVLLVVKLDLKVSGTFTVQPVRNADVRAAVDGTIEHVYVEEGDRVRAGDVLVRLSERDYRVGLDKIDAAIREKRAMLEMLRAGPRAEEIVVSREALATARTRHLHAGQRLREAESIHGTRLAKAEAEARAAEERLQYATRDHDRFKELFAQGLISRKQLDDGEQEVALRQRELEVAHAERVLVSKDTLSDIRQELAVTQTQMAEADGKLKLVRAGPRAEAIESAHAEIERLETERRYLAQQVRLTTIVSPASGVVTTPKLKEKVGEHVRTGTLILKVYELDTLRPEIAVPEKEIAEIQPGQRVVLKARAYPEHSFTGKVNAIAPAGADDADLARKVFKVTVQMDAPSDLLKPEMTGHAKISCGSRPILQILTRRIARYVRVEFWSWW